MRSASAMTLSCIAILLLADTADARRQAASEPERCLACHSKEHLATTFLDGRQRSVYVSAQKLAASVHQDLDCSDCHVNHSTDEHPVQKFVSGNAFTAVMARSCRECHEPDDGMHGRLLTNLGAESCLTCHGAHGVKSVSSAGAEDACLQCHKRELSISFADGTELSAQVNDDALTGSVHEDLDCEDCHSVQADGTHSAAPFPDRRAFSQAASHLCESCHDEHYESSKAGIHAAKLLQGKRDAPVCTDCHGSHQVVSVQHDKKSIAKLCGDCHSGVYQDYAASAHGAALLSDRNQDVPTCTDCHNVHRISDPTHRDFRFAVPDLCGDCHANKDLMRRYGLSTAVLTSYLEDFHGVTATFYSGQEASERRIAVCTDCHGIHDIMSTRGMDAPDLAEKMLARCQACHPDATESFPDAWMSHYPPTLDRSPWVFAVTIGYRVFIPFMMLGLTLQIALHAWRYLRPR